jgi:hypothetical protein
MTAITAISSVEIMPQHHQQPHTQEHDQSYADPWLFVYFGDEV